ncbi:XOO1806 family protein [Thermomonas sp.]
MLALACASGSVQAQAKQGKRDSAVVPVLNKASGKLEAFLLLEPTTTTAGTRWRFGSTTLEATYGLQTGDSLALLCDRRSGIGGEIVQLANSCVLASLDGENAGNGSRHGTAGASVSRNGNKVGVAVGSGRDTLPAWLAPNKVNNKVDQNDFTLFAEKDIGRDSFVSVGGTVARVRLVPAADVPKLADQWNTRSLTVGAGYGSFGANIVGRVVNVPGESSVWKGLGLGLTWRTPWSGQLSVGAENVVTRGKNPFSVSNGQDDEGTVPYVRYQQDL